MLLVIKIQFSLNYSGLQNQIILHKTHASKNNTSASSFEQYTTQSYLTLFEKFQTAILPYIGWNGKEDYVLWKCLKDKWQ